MKIRVPSRNAGLVAESWGATPVSMPVSEIYNALQTGVIDGALIDGTGTNAFRLGEVANYLTVGMDTTISSWHEYEADLEANLVDLHGRVQRGAYRAKPSRRQYIPKPEPPSDQKPATATPRSASAAGCPSERR